MKFSNTVIGIYIIWVIIHLFLLIASGNITGSIGDGFWPFINYWRINEMRGDWGIEMFGLSTPLSEVGRYDLSEFFAFVIGIPGVIVAIKLIKSDRKTKNTNTD